MKPGKENTFQGASEWTFPFCVYSMGKLTLFAEAGYKANHPYASLPLCESDCFPMLIAGRLNKIFQVILWSAFWCVLADSTALAQYRFDHWTADNGLPQNSVRDILQTRDGYLWLATFDGLVRFDGVRFTVFNKSNSPGILTNRFVNLYEDGQGALWAGTEEIGALTRLHQGRFITFTRENGLPGPPARAIGDDGQGNLLFFVQQQPWRWLDGRFQRLDAVRLPVTEKSKAVQETALVPGNEQYFLFWGAGKLHTVSRINFEYYGISEDHQERFWAGSATGLLRYEQGELRSSGVPGGPLAGRRTMLVQGRQPLQTLTWAADGSLWLTAVETGQRRLLVTQPPEGMSGLADRGGDVVTVYSDHEGNLWIGTSHHGLYRARPQSLTTYAKAQGLTGTDIYPLLEDRAGVKWIGTSGQGVFQFQNESFKNIPIGRGGFGNDVTALHHDRAGRLWIGAINHVDRWEAGRIETLSSDIAPRELGTYWTIHEDQEGAVWLGASSGVLRYQHGVATRFTTKEGLAGDDTKVIIEDAAGGLWLGSYGGLTQYHQGSFKAWKEPDGLPSNNVRALYQDAGGVLWIGTYDGGLGRFKDGKFTRYTVRDGLFDSGVFQILEDDSGWLWMGCNRGIYRVRKQELNDFADGKTRTITSISYGKGDGMENVECNGGRWPAGFKGRDGKLWFPTMGGVVVVDPATITTNAQPPPVVIEAMHLNNEAVPVETWQSAIRNPNFAIQIRAEQENFEIEYTALSFINSARQRFRYKLEGLDHDWVEAGTRRTAYFSHVPPGSYTFRVIAANSDGIWNLTGQSVRLTVLPPFYRTWWFVTLALLALFGAVFGGFRYRFKQLEQRQAAQQDFAQQLIESQEAERKRIAAELHDGLGQNLIIIKNWAALGLNFTEPSAPVREQLQEISETALQSLKEVREIINNLRPHQLETIGLGQTLKFMCEQAAAAAGLELRMEIAPLDGVLPPADEVTFFRLVQEGLNNILKHAQATRAAIVIERGAGTMRLTMEDNGRGFDPAELPQRGGFGLKGLAERARQLGGAFQLQTAPGQGTKIRITLQDKTHEQ